jgi:hypothetical protein
MMVGLFFKIVSAWQAISIPVNWAALKYLRIARECGCEVQELDEITDMVGGGLAGHDKAD